MQPAAADAVSSFRFRRARVRRAEWTHESGSPCGAAIWRLSSLAAEVSRQSGKQLAYADLPPEAFKGVLVGAGLPGVVADIYVDADLNIVKGELDDRSGTLRALIGRATTPLATAVAEGLARVR